MKINELYETVINYQTQNRVFFQNAENWDIRRLGEMYKEGELVLQDWFQRDYCWSKMQVCSLIHTLLHTPTLLPEIVLIKIGQKYYVADGHQRLRSILIEVLDNPNFRYRSKELTELTKYYNVGPKKNTDIWKEFTREIERKTITVKVILNNNLDEAESRNLKSYVFKKWNNGTALSAAEKRGAIPSDLNLDVIQKLKTNIPLHKQLAVLVAKNTTKNKFNELIEKVFYHFTNPVALHDPTEKKGGFDIIHSYSEDEYSGKFNTFYKLFMVMTDTVYNYTEFNGQFGPGSCCMRDVITFVNDLYLKNEIKTMDEYSMYLTSVLDILQTTYYNNNQFKDYHTGNYDAIDMEINNTWFKGFFVHYGNAQDHKFVYRRTFLYDNRELFGKLVDYDPQRLFTITQKQVKYNEQNKMCAGLDGTCKYHGINTVPFNEMEGDHIVEHTNGGRTTMDNLQMLCGQCHMEKTKKFNTKEPVL